MVSAYTGPSEGLTGVNSSKKLKAFELPADAEVDIIDEDLDNENQSLGKDNTLFLFPQSDLCVIKPNFDHLLNHLPICS